MTISHVTYRLARDGRHAYLDESGAFIGTGVPLLEKGAAGDWRPRRRIALERLFCIGYAQPVDLEWRMTKLGAVARALNAGDRSLAAIALVQLNLPPLPDLDAAARMAEADGLAKDVNSDEPRDSQGCWTTTYSVKSMLLSKQGLEFIKRRERFEPRTYLDSAGHPTIGYGHKLLPSESYPNGISKPDAEKLLVQDVAAAEGAVRRNVTVELTQSQFDALVSFTYNEGPKNFAGSTLLRRLNAGDFAGAAAEFPIWNKETRNKQLVVNDGLTNRRHCEQRLFAFGDYL